MARGALRGVATGALTLIVLQGLVSRGGSGQVANLLADVNGLVLRVFDPTVPAIPDHSTGSASSLGSAPVAGSPAAPTYGPDRATPRIPIPGLNAAT